MPYIGIQRICIKFTFSLLIVGISYTLYAQEKNSAIAKISSFGGAVTIQSKGISTIPNLTLGNPAAVFDLKVGRKLTVEPQFRFSLDGKPWAMVFWWRYYGSIGDKFRVTFHTNYSLSYKSITNYTSPGIPQEIFRTTRYLVGAISPDFQVNKYMCLGMYLFYNCGLETFITRNTYMVSFTPTFSNIPTTKNITGRVAPEISFLKMDNNDGVFFNSRFLISKKNYPLSISGLINKPLKSNIPSEYDFLCNLVLTYTFNNKYMKI